MPQQGFLAHVDTFAPGSRATESDSIKYTLFFLQTLSVGKVKKCSTKI